jgi:hypothetical protein
MTVNLPQALVGALIGAIIAFPSGGLAIPALRKWIDRRAQTKRYRTLAGIYTNHRVNRDTQVHEPTGGTIELVWDQRKAVFRVMGLHPSGLEDWHGTIKMDSEFEDRGTGQYQYDSGAGGNQIGTSGTQLVIYDRASRTFHVMARTSNGLEFAHFWRRKN